MTLNYIGSKLSLLDFIHFIVQKEIKEEISVVGDLFAGTGIVGQSFKRKGYKIISNDIQYYSFVLNKKFLTNNDFVKFEGLKDEIPNLSNYDKKERILQVLKHLNNLKEKEKGFIFNNYSLGGTKGQEFERLYFSDENALKIDTIRLKIENWFKDKKICEREYFYLLGTLIEASDKVANTASVYGAFLKSLKKSAQKELQLEYNEIIFGDKENIVFNDDIIKILNVEKIDLLYLDPPYNARQYCSNYHMLETISKYDSPQLSGKTGLRNYQKQKSKFCGRNSVKEEFERIVKKTNAKYILLSYNNEGLMTIKDVQEILSLRGEPKTFILKYKRFKADKTENRNHKSDCTYEYLHFVKCDENNEEIKKKEFPIIEIDSLTLNNQTKLIDKNGKP
jgi:adenine-specific DNA-methyltransferase